MSLTLSLRSNNFLLGLQGHLSFSKILSPSHHIRKGQVLHISTGSHINMEMYAQIVDCVFGTGLWVLRVNHQQRLTQAVMRIPRCEERNSKVGPTQESFSMNALLVCEILQILCSILQWNQLLLSFLKI